MLRPAITESLKAFEEREGCTVNVVYNGCGVLVAQMRAGENPDAYFSCDMKFLEMVEERFEDSTTVSANDMVMLVKKQNPKNVKGLEDLTREDLKKGLCHPEKSALGFLSVELLKRHNLLERVKAAGNLIDSASGDFLINQINFYICSV